MNEIALAYYAQYTMTHGTAMQIAATEAVAEIERLRAALAAGLGPTVPKRADMPDAMEAAIAAVLEMQFELGVLAGKKGRRSIGPKDCAVWAAAIKRMVAEVQVALDDAKRYHWLRSRTAGLSDNEGRQYFSFPSLFGLRPVGNIMQGSVGQHLDKAIDAGGLGPNVPHERQAR